MAEGLVVLSARVPGLAPFMRPLAPWHPPNIADDLGALLAGVALWLLVTEGPAVFRRRVARAVSVVLVAVSAAALIDTLAEWNIAARVAASDVVTGPNTSVAFLALGIGLWLLDRKTRMSAWLVQACIGLATAIGILALLGYIYRIDALSRVGAYSRMPLPTTAVIITLAVGLLLARPDRGMARIFSAEGPGGVMARRLVVPILVIAPAFDLIGDAIEAEKLLTPRVALMLDSALLVLLLEGLALTTFAILERTDASRRLAEQEVQRHRDHLEELVEQRTHQLAVANERMHQEKEFSETVVDGLPGIFALLDAGGHVLRCNRNFRRVTGRSEQDCAEIRLADIIADESRDAVAARIHDALAAGQATAETWLLGADGHVTPYVFNWVRLTLDGRQYLIAIGIDIADRRKAERDRDRMFNLSIDMVATADFDGRFMTVNPAFSKTLGWSDQELTGRPFLDFVYPDDRENTLATLAGLSTGREVVDFENRYRTRDGTIKWISWNAFPLPSERVIFAIGRDVTERKDAEQAVGRLAALVEYSGDAIISTALDGRIATWNAGAEKLYGYAAAEAIGRHVDFLVPPDLVDQRARAVERVVAGKAFDYFESIRMRKGGTLVPVSLSASAIRDRQGNVTGVSTIARDITERKKTEDELLRLNAELERRATELEGANRELEAFSYSVSHDLRAPLRTIDGFSKIVLEEHSRALHPEAQRYLGLVRQGAQQMGRLIDDLLVFSRTGRQALRKEPVDAADLVRQVVTELERDTAGRAIAFRIADLPSCYADPQLLHQVWVNLLGNAVKFTGQREAAVIEVGCTTRDGETVYFVKDNGAGFDMEYAGKLFGIFQRLHSSREFPGTGVGLAIVQRIVTRHGGRVWAEAAVDRGAAFYFTLGETSHGEPDDRRDSSGRGQSERRGTGAARA